VIIQAAPGDGYNLHATRSGDNATRFDPARSFGVSEKRLGLELKALGPLSNQSDPREIARALGERVDEFLFGGDTGELFRATRTNLKKGEQLEVLLRLPDGDSFLRLIPWEFCFDRRTQQYLCTSKDVTIVRSLSVEVASAPATADQTLRILFMGASPKGRPAIAHAEEAEGIASRLPDAIDSPVVFERVDGSTFADLKSCLDRADPVHILHISSHGGVAGGGFVEFEMPETKRPDKIDADRLGQLITERDDIGLVVLNACEGSAKSFRPMTGMAATLLAQGIPLVIAKQFEIATEPAAQFAATFYEQLSRGSAVGRALKDGRDTLRASGVQQIATPTLHATGPGAAHFVPVPILDKPEPRPWKRWLAGAALFAGVAFAGSRLLSPTPTDPDGPPTTNASEVDQATEEGGTEPTTTKPEEKGPTESAAVVSTSFPTELITNCTPAVAEEADAILDELFKNADTRIHAVWLDSDGDCVHDNFEKDSSGTSADDATKRPCETAHCALPSLAEQSEFFETEDCTLLVSGEENFGGVEGWTVEIDACRIPGDYDLSEIEYDEVLNLVLPDPRQLDLTGASARGLTVIDGGDHLALILRNADLQDAHFAFGRFTRSDFSGANLVGATFQQGQFGLTDLSGATLSEQLTSAEEEMGKVPRPPVAFIEIECSDGVLNVPPDEAVDFAPDSCF